MKRRRAAWKYFPEQGLDGPAREVIAKRSDTEGSQSRRHLVALDPELIDAVGLHVVVAWFQEFHWRAQAVESALSVGSLDVPTVLVQHPAEVLFAIRRQRATEWAPLIDRALELFPDEPRIATGALQAYAAFGDQRRVRSTEAIGRDVIARMSEHYDLPERPR